jgi:paraquat-inducible protein B
MSRKANPTVIGSFVLIALALLVAALVVFGGGRLFARTETFVMFFEDDVAGLQVGAPVTFRGVRIGSVTDVQIRYDSNTREVTIPVMVELQRRQVMLDGPGALEDINQLIQRGLRAELKVQSFVTGQVVIDLDFDTSVPARLVGAIPNYPEIPTRRSSISQLRATISDLISELRKLPLDVMIEQFTNVSQNAATLVTHVDMLVIDINKHINASFSEVPELVKEMRALIADVNTAADEVVALTKTANRDVPAITKGTVEAVNRLNRTLDQARASMASVQDTLGERSSLQFQMSQALTEITAAASAMRVLAEYLQENPGVLLSGKGAPQR